jgi:alcohol dehydrogenase (cytochrome c)
MKRSTLALFILAAFAHGGPVHAGVTTADIENDARTTGDVLSWGMGTEGQRYSPLTRINTKNVKRLVPAWSYSYGGEKQRGQESQPLVVGGKMFVTASYSRILRARHQDRPQAVVLRAPPARRHHALLRRDQPRRRRLRQPGHLRTLDAQLVALDQNTGKVVWKEKIDDYQAGYSSSAAPDHRQGPGADRRVRR